MPTSSPAHAHVNRPSFQGRWTRPLIALTLLIAATAFFVGAGATSQRLNGANTGPGAGAVSNILFGGCLVCVLALIAFGIATLLVNRRVRRSSDDIS